MWDQRHAPSSSAEQRATPYAEACAAAQPIRAAKSMRARMLVLPLILVAAGRPLVAGEEVNLSRYHALGSIPSASAGEDFVIIEWTKVEDLCGDDDGCLMTLKVDGPSAIEFSSQRVFMSAHNALYKSSLSTASHIDGAGGREDLVVVNYTDVACWVTDADTFLTLEDVGPGFSLFFLVESPGAALTCALHIDD
jgi:hypothetical protein